METYRGQGQRVSIKSDSLRELDCLSCKMVVIKYIVNISFSSCHFERVSRNRWYLIGPPMSGSVTNIDGVSEIGKPSSNSGLVSCVHFRANIFGRGMNPFLLPQKLEG